MTNRTKAIIFSVGMGICLILSVLGWHFTEVAKSPFWWNAWIVIAIVSAVLFIGGIYWYSNTKKKW